MDQFVEAAFIKAISIENQSLNLYRAMALKVADERTRKIFERMAEEESEHLNSFCTVYPGDIPDLLNKITRSSLFEETKYQELLESVNADTDELKALEISIHEEKACIDYYVMFVDVIRDSGIHSVFQRALADTRNHLEMLSDEYLRLRAIGGEQEQPFLQAGSGNS